MLINWFYVKVFVVVAVVVVLISRVSGIFPLWGGGVPTPIHTYTLLYYRYVRMHGLVKFHTTTSYLIIP